MAKKKSRPMLSAISPASAAEAYEAAYFARKCGLTRDEALKMMREAQAGVRAPSEGKRKG
ncbi:MAG: hypothetical protein EOS54_10045 [Mesorhizobium sp.]|uniref:hypothetical protein n=2 Tax=unclassified Mesorhizobium TaxID=325217 RepID=UPI000F7604AA|nr:MULTISPECIES: hypothetical protein [unclassified Mesorhizobium]AZO47754.1 hypothetical protein EJ073_07890 [Mesorhizobium sp. M4B.F.Ca.ET.058.02.1.1]RUX44668.1 hypothetical protein EOA33_26125 [Mesorhizobium sp. M4A.F.Ca.ET.050.02.1.1]RVC44497.1 hypothetical protein EN781_13755 [Mesorhizobium sp. M4A.F.Ca.ET.090.04.2.1]RWC11040.1 MAG: hypothetical protein EOS53_27960 [Mesorhizobium sp.]RWC54658.1 MAG: hypothetical protein EOS54_10045 [Mesorhizobium sp.]